MSALDLAVIIGGLGLIAFLLRFFFGPKQGRAAAMPAPAAHTTIGGNEMRQNPVCGMDVDPDRAAGMSECQGQPQYFCSASCKQRFDQGPRRYAEQAGAER